MSEIHDINAARSRRYIELKQRALSNLSSILSTLSRLKQLPIPRRDVCFIDLLIKNASDAKTSINNGANNIDFDQGRIDVVVHITEELVKQYEDLFS